MAARVDKVVIQQTLVMALGAAVMSGIEQAVFLITGYWSVAVLLANLAMAAFMVLNYFVLGLTVQRALNDEPDRAKTRMRISQTLRFIAIAAVAVGGYFIINAATGELTAFYALLPPILFNRITLLVYGFFIPKDNAPAVQTSQEGNTDEDEG